MEATPTLLSVSAPGCRNNGANVVVVWPASPDSEKGDSPDDGYYNNSITAIGNRIENGPQLSIYPNPAKEFLQLKTQQPFNGSLRIFNMQGQLMHQGNSNQNRLDLKLLTPGSYNLEIKENGGSATRKPFIKL